MLIMIFAMLLLIAGIAFIKYRQIQAGIAMGAKFAPPPAAVTTVAVKGQTWQPVINAVGSLKAVNGVVVSTDLAGIVAEIAFESGTEVKKGQLLVTLDTDQEQAQLQSAEARLSLAKTDLERKRDLVAKKAIAQSEWDQAQSQLSQMQAEVEEMKALVARKRITAPFDGLLGIRQVSPGQYLNPGAAIVPLQSLDPIYIDFALPQQHLKSVVVGKKLRINAAGAADEAFEGEITAIDSRIDESTRNFMVQGTIKNAKLNLRPGMFADVEVLLPETEGVLAVPTSSVAYAPYGDSVYVVRDAVDDKGQPVLGADGKPTKEAQQQFVKLGAKRGDQVTVTSGLKEGDEVVTSGVFKLRPGAPVQINNSVQPGNDLNPKPADT
jgi:membrane fusion protein (multidrug efflux system)